MNSLDSAPDLAVPVFETIEKAGLDLSKFILHGSSVMALYGIRPANDVDLIVEPDFFDAMFEDRLTPGGVLLRRIVSTGASTMGTRLLTAFSPAEGCLPLDMGTFSLGDKAKRFKNLWEHTVKHQTSAGELSHLSLENILYHKSHSWKPRHRHDAHRIRRYMRKEGLEPLI